VHSRSLESISVDVDTKLGLTRDRFCTGGGPAAFQNSTQSSCLLQRACGVSSIPATGARDDASLWQNTGITTDGYENPRGWMKDRADGQSTITQSADAPMDGFGYNNLWGSCTSSAYGELWSRSYWGSSSVWARSVPWIAHREDRVAQDREKHLATL
jgi:hypothetical protein